MSFNWDMEEDAEDGFDEPIAPADPKKRRRRPILIILSSLVVLVTTAGVGWGQFQIRQERQETQRQLQNFIDDQVRYLSEGDGERFLNSIGTDQFWQADQLHPRNIEFWQGAPRITDFTYKDTLILANVEWDDPSGLTLQKVLMVREEVGDSVSLGPPPASFWGDLETIETAYGSLRYYEVDEAYVTVIDQMVAEIEAEHCPAEEPACLEFDLFLSIRQSTLSDPIAWPSPRVWGLDENGEPPQAYWDAFKRYLVLNVPAEPVVIRFAVPAVESFIYDRYAREFEELNPNYKIELIMYNTLDPNGYDFSKVDGGVVSPTFEMVKSGELLDLTDLASTDAEFNRSDFYSQHWEAAKWRNRIWFVPRSAEYSLIYFDPLKYGLNLGQLLDSEWDWDEFWTLAETISADGEYPWQFVSNRSDWLYALAYAHANRCLDIIRIDCNGIIDEADIEFVLTTLEDRQDAFPDYSGLTLVELRNAYQNDIAASTEQTAIWIDTPVNYEHHVILRGSLLLPYPSLQAEMNITPLTVDGYGISATSDQPVATWRWIQFVSQRPLNQTDRRIPARPSIAESTRYWEDLPIPISRVILELFPKSRPILIHEKGLLSDELLQRYQEGDQSAEEFAEALIAEQELGWFGQTGSE